MTTIEEYIEALPLERRDAMEKLMETIRLNIPDGFEETMNYNMPSWVVPHSLFPQGYHVNPELPLPFLSIASQRGHIGLYHMGIYASPTLMKWFTLEYPNHCKTKIDMGKSCIRFKNVSKIPYQLIGMLCSKMSAQEWINLYQE